MAKKLTFIEKLLVKVATDFENNFMKNGTITVLSFDDLRNLSFSIDFVKRFIYKVNNAAQRKRNAFAVELFNVSMEQLQNDLSSKIMDSLKEAGTTIKSEDFLDFIKQVDPKNKQVTH